MRGRRALLVAVALVACRRGSDATNDAGGQPPSSPPAAPASGSPLVVAEPVPRCRAEGAALPLPGEDVVLGDVAIADGALLVGLARREGGKRIASVARVPFDVATLKTTDIGPSLGDDPPPSPRVNAGVAYAAWYARPAPASAPPPAAGAPRTVTLSRELRVAKLDAAGTAPPLGVVVQQADESFAFDIAWTEGAGDDKPLVAWDEDAERKAGALLADRGVVKVQLLGAASSTAKIVSPETSDAEEPHLVRKKGGGYWLAWLARRPEAVDAGALPEGPGERRAFRWVELVALDARGEPQGTPRRLTSERGRVASFELSAPAEKGEVFALVVDETAPSEGAGARLLGITVEGDVVETSELATSGVAHASAELLPAPADAHRRWLAWTDLQEHVVLAPLARPVAKPSTETALGSARPLAALPRGLVSANAVKAGESGVAGGPVELRRFLCE